MAAARLQRELKGVNQDTTSGVQAHPVDGSGFSKIIGVLSGPSDTPYAGKFPDHNTKIAP
jgi:ubiquitin-protein ligase